MVWLEGENPYLQILTSKRDRKQTYQLAIANVAIEYIFPTLGDLEIPIFKTDTWRGERTNIVMKLFLLLALKTSLPVYVQAREYF